MGSVLKIVSRFGSILPRILVWIFLVGLVACGVSLPRPTLDNELNLTHSPIATAIATHMVTRAIPPATVTTIPTTTNFQRIEATLPYEFATESVASPIPTSKLETIRFAVIGDYGLAGSGQEKVSRMVKSWEPEFVITTGDNNYPNGEATTIDENIGQYYSEFIHPYQGNYGPGAPDNRFFPSPGNHDWNSGDLKPYLDYFTLPGNERYYDFTWGPVHFFAIDSDSREPDGISLDSIQAGWLRKGLATSGDSWNIVYMHHSPYSSGQHGSIEWMRWPFKEWGATAVLAGHDHVYERLLIDGFPYFINGLGGTSRYLFLFNVPGSQVRYRADHGALLIEANRERITFKFTNIDGELIDSYSLNK